MAHPDQPLADPTLLSRRRARARREALFLHDLARDEVKDRLSMVNRAFTSPAVVAPLPEIWAEDFPDAARVTDAETLDLSEGRHDLVVHAMGLHWSNDPVGQLIQSRRALKPDGLLLAVFPGGETLTELRSCLSQAEIEVTGGLSPRVAPMADLRAAGDLLHRAGLALPVADTVPLTAEYRDLDHLMRDLRDMGETNALTGRLRHPTRRSVFDRANRLYKDHFALPGGKIPATFELIVLTGWAPAETQPKPLRPGSAQTRLADALGTTEIDLPD